RTRPCARTGADVSRRRREARCDARAGHTAPAREVRVRRHTGGGRRPRALAARRRCVPHRVRHAAGTDDARRRGASLRPGAAPPPLVLQRIPGPMATLTLVRHATLVLETRFGRILVDPMLRAAGTTPPIENTPNPLRNPLVDLPL